jgi:hypothetical protein
MVIRTRAAPPAPPFRTEEAMYPLDLMTLPGNFLRRTRLWYARGRTWSRTPTRPAPRESRAPVSQPPAMRAG